MKDNKVLKIIIKLVLTAAVLFVSYYIGLLTLLIGYSENINMVLVVGGALAIPLLFLPLIYVKKKKSVFKWWGIYALVLIIWFGIEWGIDAYNDSLIINTNPNINCYEYLPFKEDSKIVKLDKDASLLLEEKLPRVDGAAAVFPVYSAFVNAVYYPTTVTLGDGIFEYNNTVGGYRKLAEKETDIFFGAYPSEEQIEYATKNGTEFEFTEIGTEAFVFFVHKDNPIDNLTTEQIQDIYSGKITNWKDVGGADEEIVAFQRNEGSGSQSMLKRFMGDKEIMQAPSEQVNDLMSGIIDVVSQYKNKSSSMGFSFRYYLEGIIKNPDIKMISVDGNAPTVENIKNGTYPITTSLYAVTYKDNPNENVKLLLDWVLSEEGQEIIEKTGYVGVKVSQ
ncbi:MAG: PstS family phosphate ABC transporter substrate-binding protein [Clostridia bacterium]|nr:PstS family phosphate ABC transporter substrate-binding protein [Clostridia bacterium]